MEAPPVIASAPARSWWWLVIALPLIVGAVVLYFFNPSQHGFYPRCSLYVTTGLYCPGCGASRAAYELLHGDVLTALHDNVLFVLGLPVVGIFSLRCASRWWQNRPLSRLIISPLWIKIGVATFILFTVLRNIPAAPFNWLAPL